MRLIDPNLTGIYTGDNIEGMAKEYLRQLCRETGEPYVPITKKFVPTHIPNFTSRDREDKFWRDEMQKWRYGEGDIPGLEYVYANHAWIKKRSGGRIKPEFRRHDVVTYDLMEAMIWGESRWFGNKRGKGVIEVGKRGSGKSNRISLGAVTICSLRDASDVGFSANSDDTVSKFLVDKVKFLWSNLPNALRARVSRNSTYHMFFGEEEVDDRGNRILRGRNSNIIARSPSPEAFESLGLSAWFHDEGPKTKQLLKILQMTDPCLADDDGFTREGFVWITGVAGDFDKFGADFIEIWDAYEAYNLERVFIPGWVGMESDDKGNEDVYAAVVKILHGRSKLREGSEELLRLIQQYPLTVEEAFMTVKSQKMPVEAIRKSLQDKLSHEPLYRRGMLYDMHGQVMWRDEAKGVMEMLEPPQDDAVYGAGLDSYGLKQKYPAGAPGRNGEGSSGGLVIVKGANRNLSPQEIEEMVNRLMDPGVNYRDKLSIRLHLGMIPVFRYIDRPSNPDVYADGAILALRLYKTKGLIERVPSNIIVRIENSGYGDLRFWQPVRDAVKRVISQADYMNYGIQVDEYWAAKRHQLLYSFYESYADNVYFDGNLSNALKYDPEVQRLKFDDIDALGLALIHMEDPRFVSDSRRIQNSAKPVGMWGIRKNSNGTFSGGVV